jgi:hypothetical protein
MILSRPLLTDSLALAEFASAGEKRRAELAVGWELATLADLEGVMIDGEAMGEAVPEAREALEVRRAQIQEYAQRHDLSTQHWKPDGQAKALAEKHGRREEYLDLRILHHFTHGSTFATSQRHRRDEERDEEVVLIGGPAADQESWIRGVVVSAGQSGLHAGRAMARILGAEEPPEIAPLLAEIEALAAQAEAEEDEAD